jgi:thiol-disulfide isomerase/thioredoxin
MKNLIRVIAAAAIVAAATITTGAGQQSAGVAQAPASESQGTPEAKAAFAEAEALRQKQKFAEAAPLYKRAAELDPRFVEAHWMYIWNSQIGDKDRDAATARVRAEYEALAKANPESAIYQWALGKLAGGYVESEPFFKRAIELDPKFARPYMDLSLISDFRGENDKEVDYLRKAAELNPEDPQYLFYYASASRDDEALHRKLSLEVAAKFPAHERGAQALYWLGQRSSDPAEKQSVFERLRRDYPPAKFSWSSSGMMGLFDLYQKSEPDKALALAKDMVAQLPESSAKTWKTLLAMQENVVEARRLLNDKRAADAVALLEKTATYRYVDQTPFLLTRAEARAAAGAVQQAYDELIGVVAVSPQAKLEAAAGKLAQQLGKPVDAVMADMWTVRDAKAEYAPEFTLTDYYNESKPVSLKDYRGRVVLVNFWYPACGPCRGEFPHLQAAAEKFKARGFEVLALNVHPEEDPFVVPYMKNNKFLFRPLRTDLKFAEEQYKARGFPANFLVDHKGRIVFTPGVVSNEETIAMFERQIEQLLDRAAQDAGKTVGGK